MDFQSSNLANKTNKEQFFNRLTASSGRGRWSRCWLPWIWPTGRRCFAPWLRSDPPFPASKAERSTSRLRFPEIKFFFNVFFGVPHLATYISVFSLNQDWVLSGIDPGMAFTPFPCSIWKRRDSNPQPFDREPSSLTTTLSSHSIIIASFVIPNFNDYNCLNSY